MKTLQCIELGDTNCDFVAEGNTNDEVIHKIFVHASEAHPEVLDAMSDREELAMKQKINELLDR